MNSAKFEGLAAALDAYENPQDEYGGRMDSFKELVVSPDRKKKQKTTKSADDLKFLHYLFLYSTTGATLNNSAYGSENILGKGLFPMKLKKGGRVSVNVDINGMIAFFQLLKLGKFSKMLITMTVEAKFTSIFLTTVILLMEILSSSIEEAWWFCSRLSGCR